MSCCFESRGRGPGIGDQAMFGFRPSLSVGWADPGLDPGEAQHVRAITLGFTRTAFGFSPTYGSRVPRLAGAPVPDPRPRLWSLRDPPAPSPELRSVRETSAP